MKKIALVIDNAFLYAGTENICNFMSDCFGQAHKVDIISLRGEAPSFYPFHLANNIITFNDFKYKVFRVVKYLKSNSYDRVYIISMGRLSVVFSLLMKIFQLDSSKIISCEHVSLVSFNPVVKFMKFIFLRFYHEVVVLTNRDKTILSKWKIKNRVIKNPVFFRNHDRAFNNKKALAVGRLSSQKGFDRLLNIWSEFVKNNEGWVLQIAGDGPELNNLKVLICKLNLQGSVSLLGKVQNISDLYITSDIFLMTSRYEGLPLVLLEAKSWSLPVISYDCPTGPAEIIKDGFDGYLIEDDNLQLFVHKMSFIASNPNVLKQMSLNCETSSIEFSSEEISKQWLMTLGDK